MGVFDVTQSVVNQSAGVIISDTSIDVTTVITDIEAKLDAMSVGGLLGLWFQSLFVGLTMKALSICIMLVVYGRMIEIYLVTSVAPIPMATMVNHEWGSMGQNYLKSLACAWFSGVSDLGVCRHLCGVDTNNRSDRRHFRRDLGLHGLYRPLVLYAFQNGKPCKERLFGTLRG